MALVASSDLGQVTSPAHLAHHLATLEGGPSWCLVPRKPRVRRKPRAMRPEQSGVGGGKLGG